MINSSSYYYSIILLVTVARVLSEVHFTVCQVGSVGKCLGSTMDTLDLGIPKSNAGYLLTNNGSDYRSCSDLCTWHSQCLMASFNTDTNVCNLYRKISYIHSTSPITQLYLWKCCDTNSKSDVSNRCPGFWTLRSQSKSDNTIRPLDPLATYKALSYYQCQMECAKNSICGAVNFFHQDDVDERIINCELIINFPVDKLMTMKSKDWNTFQWKCADSYRIPVPSTECVTRVGYPPGRWVVQNESAILEDTTKSLLYFFTLDNRQCFDNCALYDNCKAAWYSISSYFCVLETNDTDLCADTTPSRSDTFTVYAWEACSTNIQPMEGGESEQWSCRTLVDNRYIFIYPIKCGQLPSHKSNIYKCWDNPIPTQETGFSPHFHCHVNQSYRVYDTIKPSSSIFKELATVPWLRVYTGYQSFWLINVSDTNLRPTNKLLCDVFNSSPKVMDESPLRIVRRTEWFPNKSVKPETPYSKTAVQNVVITDTEVPLCNCFTFEACTNVMRRIQLALKPQYFSIPYSFVVSGEGVAYEARGWDQETAAVGMYNPKSLVIALCGQYKKNPSVKSLEAVKKLIKQSVDMNKVQENYTLYIYNDLRNRPFPYDGLRQVIELWPHYRNNKEKTCNPISTVTQAMVTLVIFLSLAITITCAHLFHRRIFHRPHCSSIRQCRIETMFGNINTTTVEVLPQILLHNFHNLIYEDNIISPITTSVIWIEDCHPIGEAECNPSQCHCKEAIFASLSIARIQAKLVNVGGLIRAPDVYGCSKIMVLLFERHGDIGRDHLLILHLDRVQSFYKFINRIYRNKCICDVFLLTQYDFRLSDFIDDSCWNEMRTVMVKKTASCRDSLQQKYTYSYPPGTICVSHYIPNLK